MTISVHPLFLGGNTNADTMSNPQSQTKCIAMPGNNCFAHGAIEPLPMDILDACWCLFWA